MERVSALESQVAETESAMVEANKSVDENLETIKSLTEAVSAKDAEIEQLQNDLIAANAMLDDAAKAQASAQATAEEAMESVPQAINDGVASVIASSGIPPVEAVEQEQTDILATYDSLKGAEKTVFFRRHESALRAAMRG